MAITYHAGRRVQGTSTDFNSGTITRIGSLSHAETAATGSTTWTYTHTNASGSNRIMLVSIGTETGGNVVTGVDYGGQALVEIANAEDPVGTNDVNMWYLLESGIASASNTTITITQSANTTKTASCAISYEGVDQTTPVSEYATDVTAVAPHTGLALTETSGNLLVGITGNGSAYTPTYPSTMTEQHDSNDYTSVGTQITLGDRLSITNGSIDPAPTMSGVTRNTGISVELSAYVTNNIVNAQVGSRFEETDTRKMYHYSDNGITGSDVSLSQLKAYYKFDESSGDIINEAETVGSTHSLGTNADLSINGSPSRNQTGSPANLGNSILFADPSEYGDAGTSTSQFNFMHNQSALFTFAVWIKFPSAIEHNDCIFDNNIIGDVQVGCNICLRNTNAMRFIVANGSSPVINGQTSNGFVPTDNAFHFYVFRWDYSQSTGTLLISVDNGTAESFNKTSNTASNSNAGQVARFCSDTWSGSESLSGNILELSIWNRILTNAELTTLYNSGSGKIIATDPSWKEEGT